MTAKVGDSVSKDVCPRERGDVGAGDDVAKVEAMGEGEKDRGVLDVARLDEGEKGLVGDGGDVVSDADLDVEGKKVEPERARG